MTNWALRLPRTEKQGTYCRTIAVAPNVNELVDSTTAPGVLWESAGEVWEGWNDNGWIVGDGWPMLFAKAHGTWGVGVAAWQESSVHLRIEVGVIKDDEYKTMTVGNYGPLYAPPTGEHFPVFDMTLDASHGMTQQVENGESLIVRLVLVENNLADGDTVTLSHMFADGFAGLTRYGAR